MLPERQKLLNALAKAQREGRLAPSDDKNAIEARVAPEPETVPRATLVASMQGLCSRMTLCFKRMPVLVAFWGSGSTMEVSRNLVSPLFDTAREAGIDTQLLYLPHEYPECSSWDSYVARMLQLIDEGPAGRTRPVFLFGFSSGGAPAYAVAHKLGARVIQLVCCGCRPAFNVSAKAPAGAEEGFGVVTRSQYQPRPPTEACNSPHTPTRNPPDGRGLPRCSQNSHRKTFFRG